MIQNCFVRAADKSLCRGHFEFELKLYVTSLLICRMQLEGARESAYLPYYQPTHKRPYYQSMKLKALSITFNIFFSRDICITPVFFV